MRLKKPKRASLDQVRITRHGDGKTAIIEHADETIAGTNLTIGAAILFCPNMALGRPGAISFFTMGSLTTRKRLSV